MKVLKFNGKPRIDKPVAITVTKFGTVEDGTTRFKARTISVLNRSAPYALHTSLPRPDNDKAIVNEDEEGADIILN